MTTFPLAQIGWTSDHSATRDPRIPVLCPNCLGARKVYERLDPYFAPRELVGVVCRRCSGAGVVRIERRTGER